MSTCPATSQKVSLLSKWIILALVVLAVAILWRLSSRSIAPVTFTENSMFLRYGDCRLVLPLKRIERRHRTADALSIDRTFATLFNGYTLVDERVSMPENYTFGKATDAVVRAVFGLGSVESLAKNDKMEILEGVQANGAPLRVLAIFKGKSDLELLYPLNESLQNIVTQCLIEGKASEGATVLNHVVKEDDSEVPLSRWDQKLFELDILINKDM